MVHLRGCRFFRHPFKVHPFILQRKMYPDSSMVQWFNVFFFYDVTMLICYNMSPKILFSPYAACMEYFPTFEPNVGKYSSPMDPMGMKHVFFQHQRTSACDWRRLQARAPPTILMDVEAPKVRIESEKESPSSSSTIKIHQDVSTMTMTMINYKLIVVAKFDGSRGPSSIVTDMDMNPTFSSMEEWPDGCVLSLGSRHKYTPHVEDHTCSYHPSGSQFLFLP